MRGRGSDSRIEDAVVEHPTGLQALILGIQIGRARLYTEGSVEVQVVVVFGGDRYLSYLYLGGAMEGQM